MKQQNCSGKLEQAKKNTQERQKFKTRNGARELFSAWDNDTPKALCCFYDQS